MIALSSFLLSIGTAAQKLLPDLFTALSCGVSLPVEQLNVFSLSQDQESCAEAAELASGLSACRRLPGFSGKNAVFPAGVAFASCVPSFRSLRELTEDPDASVLISALRGRGLPLSIATDREAVEWSFSDLLRRGESSSLQPFFSWLGEFPSGRDPEDPVRLFLLADLSDPFSAGILLVLLQDLRELLKNRPMSVYLIGLSEVSSPLPESVRPVLRGTLQAMEDRALLRLSGDAPARGADAAWLLSLPSSLAESGESGRLLALSAARILGAVLGGETEPAPGLHTRETDGILSLSSLGDQAPVFAARVNWMAWMLSDVFPSLQNFLSRPSRLRSLTVNPRTAVLRRLFSDVPDPAALAALPEQAGKTLRMLLSNILRLFRSVPSALRDFPEAATLWQQAVNACGRYITVASEYDTSVAEARESGLDAVRPVHRDSLADTEEEKLARRLAAMEQQLEEEGRARSGILSSLGGYRSLQVRLDCLNRCRSALRDAEKKAASRTEYADHLAFLKAERRIRLLKAAVARCEAELDPVSVQSQVSALPVSRLQHAGPYDGTCLTPEAGRALEQLCAADPADASLRIPSPLFRELPAADAKNRWKALQSACKDLVPADPFVFLLDQSLSLCAEELSGCRFLSGGGMPALPLLPDLIPESPLLTLRNVLSLLPEETPPESAVAERRGLLAMLLLRQYRSLRPGEASLVSSCVSGDSPVSRCWLSARRAEKVFVLSLDREGDAYPFALVLPGEDFLPARRTAACTPLVPSFVTWFDREKGIFSDPCNSLGEGDRMLLLERLNAFAGALSGEKASSRLGVFLREFLRDLSRDPEPFREDRALKTRIRAVCGLFSLPAYSGSVRKESCRWERFSGDDLLGSVLAGSPTFPASACTGVPEEVLYLYRDVPFARESSRLLLESPRSAGEEYTLGRLAAECSVLSASSDDYRDALVRNLAGMLSRSPSLLPEVRSSALSLLEEAENPLDRRAPEFVWPWDPKSPSMQTVLRESLGESLPLAAMNPFSDLLTVFPARGRDVIGDALLSSMCALWPAPPADPDQEAAEIPPDAVLPPLSPEFGRALCVLPEGRTLLQPGLLSFERAEEGSYRVVLTLDGAFPVRMVRTYGPEEVLNLYSHDIPTLALWPSLPLPPEDWKAYFVYAHMPEAYTLRVLPEGGEFTDVDAVAENRFSARFESFPLCFSLLREDQTMGVLPNVLPRPAAVEGCPVEVCMDFGSSGTSAVVAFSRQRKPLNGPVMVRTLLNNPASSRELLRREFIPAVPVSALFPTVVRIFRNVPGASPVPFVDGMVLMSSDLEDLVSTPSDAVYTGLKWEEEKGRSGMLCLHQILLMSALQARCEGAPSLSWRFSLPDEMAKEGRESLMNLFRSLCLSVLRESGYPASEENLPVSFASESSALGAYFRYCAPEDTRGGFMVLDLGAGTADISLFLRGREQAVRTCQIPLGVHYMLLPSLLRDPDLLAREFGLCPDERFLRDLSLLTKALHAARTDAVALRRARAALDYFVADHLSLLVSMSLSLASGGTPSRAGALLLLHLSYLLMLSGLVLLQLAADPSRNDFLPEQMTLCLAGRGATLLEALPPPLKTSLWHFLSMFRNRRVASLSLLFSSEKKMEIPVGLSMLQETYPGLPPASVVPASVAVRPSELLPEFLLRFRREFPASAEMLFPGFFTGDYYHPFTDRGDALIAASLDQSFPPAEMPRPYDSLSAWIGNLLDLA